MIFLVKIELEHSSDSYKVTLHFSYPLRHFNRLKTYIKAGTNWNIKKKASRELPRTHYNIIIIPNTYRL